MQFLCKTKIIDHDNCSGIAIGWDSDSKQTVIIIADPS